MSEMVERVAEAIRMSRSPSIFPKWEDLEIEIKQLYYKEAKAAIEAMREPTDEMYMAYSYYGHLDIEAYKAMIDAALKDNSNESVTVTDNENQDSKSNV